MLDLEPGEREFMMEMRMLSTDRDGQEILVGLTHAESLRFLTYSRNRLKPDRDHDPESEDDHEDLQSRHEMARLRVLAAEAELRLDKPMRH